MSDVERMFGPGNLNLGHHSSLGYSKVFSASLTRPFHSLRWYEQKSYLRKLSQSLGQAGVPRQEMAGSFGTNCRRQKGFFTGLSLVPIKGCARKAGEAFPQYMKAKPELAFFT
jgi:hypothetical protein